MKYKIAIASTDRKLVNQHFGRADNFVIVIVDDEERILQYIEKREITPICHGGNHSDIELENAANVLEDCDYVLVSRIGQSARNVLESKGIEAFELPGVIGESIDAMLNYLEVRNMLI